MLTQAVQCPSDFNKKFSSRKFEKGVSKKFIYCHGWIVTESHSNGFASSNRKMIQFLFRIENKKKQIKSNFHINELTLHLSNAIISFIIESILNRVNPKLVHAFECVTFH